MAIYNINMPYPKSQTKIPALTKKTWGQVHSPRCENLPIRLPLIDQAYGSQWTARGQLSHRELSRAHVDDLTAWEHMLYQKKQPMGIGKEKRSAPTSRD